MKRVITLGRESFELVTHDWPFDDDEARCLELAESRLAELQKILFASELPSPSAEVCEIEFEFILMMSLMDATSDYKTGLNGFECLLELRPLVTA